MEETAALQIPENHRSSVLCGLLSGDTPKAYYKLSLEIMIVAELIEEVQKVALNGPKCLDRRVNRCETLEYFCARRCA